MRRMKLGRLCRLCRLSRPARPDRSKDHSKTIKQAEKAEPLAETQPTNIKCNACGAKYRWSEKLAGKRVKCKCGETLSFPKTPQGVSSSASKNAAKADKPSKSSKPKKLKSQHGDSMFDSEGAYRLNLEDIEKEKTATVNCPNCDTELPQGAIICTECGVNARTGQAVSGAGNDKDKKGGPSIGTLFKIALVLALLGTAAWAVQNYLLGAK